MAFLQGFALLLAARVTSIASLKTKVSKNLMENAWQFQDLFQLDEDPRLRQKLALVRTGAGNTKPSHKIYDKFPLPNWCSARVTSNLGGIGPDTSAAPELRYAGMQGIENEEHVKSIDMIVTALSTYESRHPEMNGFNTKGSLSDPDSGCFGLININSDESVELEFKFVESGTNNTVHVNLLEFLLYDIDMGPNNTGVESLTIYDDCVRYLKSPNAQFSETGDLSTGVTFTATSMGTGADNPQNPNSLTVEQMDKTFIGVYENVEKFHVTFAVAGGKGGRNFMFAGKTIAASDPEYSPSCKSDDCVIWGDPHVLTFDAHREFTMLHPNPRAFFQMRSNDKRSDVVNVLEEGQFWLVKSDDVHIQGRYNKRPRQNTTVLGGLAVGGPFLKGNTFIVRPLVGKITWNGEEVLSNLGSEFSNDLIHAKYRAGVENVKDGSKGNGVEVTLPGDVKLIVNRLTRGLAVKISMCAREWQDGQCGNFNGISKDDRQNVLMERVQPLQPKDALPWREHLRGDAVFTRT